MQGEHSALLGYHLSVFEEPFDTGFTVYIVIKNKRSVRKSPTRK